MSFPIVAKPDNKGFGMGQWVQRLTAGVAITKGKVYAIDLSAITVTDIDDGDGTTVGHSVDVGTMVLPAAAGTTIESVDNGIFAVAMESASSGDKCLFMFKGVIDANIALSGVAKGSILGVATDGQMVIGTSGLKCVGYLLEATDGTDQDKPVLFDGVNGFTGAVA